VAVAALGALVALGALGAGCGAEDPVDAYTGTWRIVQGSYRQECPGSPPTSEPLSGNVSFVSTDPDAMLRTDADTPCTYRFEVDDDGPWLVPGQVCTLLYEDEQGAQYTVKVEPRTWTIQELTENRITERHIKWLTVIHRGQAHTCTVTTTATLERMGQ
jgi:hypothetical protein